MTLEHIPKALSPQGIIPSAPKDFAVYVSALARTRGRSGGTRWEGAVVEDVGGED